ncbi:MAG: hypothetical protein R3182_12970 [Draconibacterium sp.]|nr:hypothetical protein [Draconibacterium sp.]
MIPLIKETVLKQLDRTELDLEVLAELIGPEWEDYEWHTENAEGETIRYWVEGDLFNLDLLQQTIDELKKLNATHVRICQHGDHHGYYLSGSKLEVLSEEDALELRKKKLKEEIQIAEGQYGQNKNALTEQMNEIAKMHEDLARLDGDVPEEEREE